ncbi:MAG: hypothetical protein K6C98_02690 [Treponema sp.]|nr:hypothetical protein [Treponema sp.]
MTVGEFLKSLPENSLVSWREQNATYNNIGILVEKDEKKLCFSDMTLKEFLKDNSSSYRTRDLKLEDRSGEQFSITIIPYFDWFKIEIVRQFLD